jgi:hypothetical protein
MKLSIVPPGRRWHACKEMHAHEMYAYKIHAYEIHAYEIYAYDPARVIPLA